VDDGLIVIIVPDANDLVVAWAEGLSSLYPKVDVQIEGIGSTVAPPAPVLLLANGALGGSTAAAERAKVD
jgi:hypothetical protein